MKLIKSIRYILVFSLITLFAGCSSTKYDDPRHENLTDLKAFHVKFIQDYTEAETKTETTTWDQASVKSRCDQGELKFKDAYTYARSKDKGDDTGSKAVKELNAQFSRNCAMLLKRKKHFSKTFAEGEDGILSEIKQQYDLAIAGEESRNPK